MDPALLSALKTKARREGSTVSAEILKLIMREVQPEPRLPKSRATMGMFPDFDAPDLSDFIGSRRENSRRLRDSVRRMRRKRR